MNHPLHLLYRFLRLLGLSVLALLFTRCKPTEQNATDPDTNTKAVYQVVATTGMIADIVREIGGERVNVHQIIGEAVDPHSYKASVTDVKALQDADLTFYNGLLLEGKMADVLARLGKTGRPFVALAEEVMANESYAHRDLLRAGDPHLWMDVEGWIQAVDCVAATLIKMDPKREEQYQQDAERYRMQLLEMDDYAKKSLVSIPKQQAVLITSHRAFDFLSRAYGIETHAIQGISSESETGLKNIESLIDLIVHRNIPAVFIESSVSEKNILALIEGARARGHQMSLGGVLFSDAMGPPGSYEGTYI
ncbi:MAG: metal ABC transporter solute-binding protein, Zn/Mn family, partial [Luteolibacter sp.]